MEEPVNFTANLFRFDEPMPDGRIISKDSFKNYDGQTVPVTAKFDNSEAKELIGTAILRATENGIIAECTIDDIVKHALEPSTMSAYVTSIMQMDSANPKVVTSGEINSITCHNK